MWGSYAGCVPFHHIGCSAEVVVGAPSRTLVFHMFDYYALLLHTTGT